MTYSRKELRRLLAEAPKAPWKAGDKHRRKWSVLHLCRGVDGDAFDGVLLDGYGEDARLACKLIPAMRGGMPALLDDLDEAVRLLERRLTPAELRNKESVSFTECAEALKWPEDVRQFLARMKGAE